MNNQPTIRDHIAAALEALVDQDLDTAEFILRTALSILDQEQAERSLGLRSPAS